MEFQDLSVCLENDGILNVYKAVFNKKVKGEFVNKLISKTTAFVNFNCSGSFLKLDSPISRLVPYPRLHFVTPSYASTTINNDPDPQIIVNMSNTLFHKDNNFVTCDYDRFMNHFGFCFVYRGIIQNSQELIRNAFSFIKYKQKAEAGKEYYFVENNRPNINSTNTAIDKSVFDAIGIKNYSGVYTFWNKIMENYEKSIENTSEVKRFLDSGLEEGELKTCKESLQSIIEDYKEFQTAVDDR